MKKRILINVNGTLAAEILFDGASLTVQGKLPAELAGIRNGEVEWNHFQELRLARNGLIHSTSPFLGFELRSLERVLNLVREGVGGFLTRIRRLQGLEPLGFMERLATAPRVEYRTAKRRKK